MRDGGLTSRRWIPSAMAVSGNVLLSVPIPPLGDVVNRPWLARAVRWEGSGAGLPRSKGGWHRGVHPCRLDASASSPEYPAGRSCRRLDA
jgi:hypothetical protein